MHHTQFLMQVLARLCYWFGYQCGWHDRGQYETEPPDRAAPIQIFFPEEGGLVTERLTIELQTGSNADRTALVRLVTQALRGAEADHLYQFRHRERCTGTAYSQGVCYFMGPNIPLETGGSWALALNTSPPITPEWFEEVHQVGASRAGKSS